MLECSRADTGVGPSMAEGSQGCNPNWADLPTAASNKPARGREGVSELRRKICCSSHVLELMRNHAMARMKPTSPMRL